MAAMKILVTGFGPFPGVTENRSGRVLRELAASPALRLHDLRVEELPTVYADVDARIDGFVASFQPDLCIGLGVWPGRTIRLERLARNATTSGAPDAAGQVRQGAVVEGAPAGWPSTLPLEAIEQRLLESGFTVTWSDDAGGYVCNHAFYRSCHAVRGLGHAGDCGFIHLPATEVAMSNWSPLTVARLAEAVEVAIAAAIDTRGISRS
jgi:pyroglutamyl-peptidase